MVQKLFDLTGKRALVTGSVRGLGHSIAEGLAEAGAEVAINGRDPDVVEIVVADFRRRGLRAVNACFDVTDETATQTALSDLAVVDILVNNAGVQRRGSAIGYPADDWNALIAANLTAVFRLWRRPGTRGPAGPGQPMASAGTVKTG